MSLIKKLSSQIPSFGQKSIYFSVIFFAVLAFINWLSHRPLWLDEDYVFQNLIKFHGRELFRILDPAQSFPRMYLIVIQWFSNFFHNHIWALRFPSFIAMLAGLCVWLKVCKKTGMPDEFIGAVMLMFAVSYRMIYYASELKPYSMDVLSAGLFAWCLLEQSQFTSKPSKFYLYAASLCLPFLIFFSYAAIFFIWIIPFNFLMMSLRNKSLWLITVLNFLVVVICVSLAYWIDIRFAAFEAASDYWSGTFICTDNGFCFFGTFADGIRKLVTFWYGNTKTFVRTASGFIPIFISGLFAWGFVSLKKNQWKIFSLESLALCVFIELFIFGLLHKFPFTGDRITLFFAPFVFYIIIKTLAWLYNKIKILGLIFWIYWLGYMSVCLINSARAFIKNV